MMQQTGLQRFGCMCTCSRSAASRFRRVAHVRPQRARRSRVWVRAQADEEARSKGESMESLFLKELQKRGISSQDEGDGAGVAEPVRKAKDPFTTTSTQLPPPIAPPSSSPAPPWADSSELDDQLSRSRRLNSEGIEGLIPRASKLVQLGGSLFLAFVPFIAAISLLFGGIYWIFGDKFVHSAPKSAGLPAYIDPDLLLSSPTVDPYVTFDSP